jgi:hypothetical protein
MPVGNRAFFVSCAKSRIPHIMLREGTSVLGWRRRSELDIDRPGGTVKDGQNSAITTGAIVDPPRDRPNVRVIKTISRQARRTALYRDLIVVGNLCFVIEL